MSIVITCHCGRRYKLENVSAGMKFKCKQCGKKITVRPKQQPATSPEDDDAEMLNFLEQTYEENDAHPPNRLPKRKSKKRKQVRGNNNRSNMIVRGLGLLIFIATVLNCLHYFLLAEKKEHKEGEPMDFSMEYSILPIFIVGTFGLYIAATGEHPDPIERRENRIKGIKWIGIGIVVAIIGFISMMRFSKLSGGVIPLFAYGAAGTGIFSCAYGILAIITGRDLREQYMKDRMGE